MPIALPSLQDRLDAARLALHRLLTGSLAEEVDTGTYRARFTRADTDKLQAYIDDLQAQIAGTSVHGAIGFVF
jgi:hypothetical protein